MRKEMGLGKRKLLFLIVGLFLFLFSIQFVMAQNVILDPIAEMFTNWEQGEVGGTLAKWLIFLVVLMFVYSISEFIPGINKFHEKGKEPLAWAFSAIVAFLALGPLSSAEISTMLLGYAALGFVLGGIVPFMVLMFFTISLAAESEKDTALIQFSKKAMAFTMWVVFLGFLIYKSLILNPGLLTSSSAGSIGHLIVIIGTVAMVVYGFSYMWKRSRKEIIETKKEKFGDIMAKSSLKVKEEAKAVDELTES